MNFELHKPTKKQFEIILLMITKQHHFCDLLDEYDMDDYNNLGDFYIVTHALVYTIIEGKSILLPLGFIQFDIYENIYKKNLESFILCHVDSRCSFGRWPLIDVHLKAISKMENNAKINIGETLSNFVESHMIQLANHNNIQKVLLFNLATEDAFKYHKKNGWKVKARDKLLQLTNSSTGQTALEDAINGADFIEGSIHMFKILNVT
jgi:hypothetical protein